MAKEREAGRTCRIRNKFFFVERNALPSPKASRANSGTEALSSIKQAITVCVIVRLSPVRRRDPAISLDF